MVKIRSWREIDVIPAPSAHLEMRRAHAVIAAKAAEKLIAQFCDEAELQGREVKSLDLILDILADFIAQATVPSKG